MSDYAPNMLTADEYIKKTNIDQIYIDTFWYTITNKKWLLIDNNMLIWIGYNCTDLYSNKVKYIKLLFENFIKEKDFKQLNTQKFNEFYSYLEVRIESPQEIINNSGNKTKTHIMWVFIFCYYFATKGRRPRKRACLIAAARAR